jgi:hypothetical protein
MEEKTREEYTFNTRRWIRIALINFCVVALAGIVLRYKINFALPFLNQKNLLHAHSHFAFTGWVALALMALMVYYLQQQKVITNYKKYFWILVANSITAYGMLITFVIQGYAFYSISFSTISLFVSYFFIFHYWRDLKQVKDDSYAPWWFKGALILWAISSLGAFTLAFLMANKIMVQEYYISAIYFFLHFQYNGWFLFACFGLLFSYFQTKGLLMLLEINRKLFLVMAITVLPAYFLSILWFKLPRLLHIIADLSGLLQILILIYFIRLLKNIKKNNPGKLTSTTRFLWILASTAFIIKIVLQMLSIVPSLTPYAFGFRPIVIGYLHLSFLGIISFFILGFINQVFSETQRRFSRAGVIIFVMGVLLQEIVLMLQGVEALELEPLPYANLILFYTAIVMGIGLIWIASSTLKNYRQSESN